MGSSIQNRENMQITNINFLFECMNEAWLTVSVCMSVLCMYACVCWLCSKKLKVSALGCMNELNEASQARLGNNWAYKVPQCV